MTTTIKEEAPHIAAIKRSIDAGFSFLHLRNTDGVTVAAIHAERHRAGAIETYTVRATTEAIAARFRVEDYPYGSPLWQEHGTAAEVIQALLELPAHGSSGAPTITKRISSSLWLPGDP